VVPRVVVVGRLRSSHVFLHLRSDRPRPRVSVSVGYLMDTLGIGIHCSPEELEMSIGEIDTDSNGEMDFEGTINFFLDVATGTDGRPRTCE